MNGWMCGFRDAAVAAPSVVFSHAELAIDQRAEQIALGDDTGARLLPAFKLRHQWLTA